MMYKAIVEYAKINKGMKLKFNLILKSEDNKYGRGSIIDKFNYNGTDFLKITPHPFLTIDISSNLANGETWSSNKTVNLNQQAVFMAKRRIRETLDLLSTEDLFMYVHDRLVVNRELANELTTKFMSSNKHVLIRPVVVYDDEDTTIEYEGICLMINTVDNFCNLTIDEAEYLYDLLDKINLTETSLSVINTSMLMKTIKSVKLEIPVKPVKEVKQVEEDININFSNKTEENQIPDI